MRQKTLNPCKFSLITTLTLEKTVIQPPLKSQDQDNIQSCLVSRSMADTQFLNIKTLAPDWSIQLPQLDSQKEESQELPDPVTTQEKNNPWPRLANTSSLSLRTVGVGLLDSHRETLGVLKREEEIQDQDIIVFLLISDIMNQRMPKEWPKHHIIKKDPVEALFAR